MLQPVSSAMTLMDFSRQDALNLMSPEPWGLDPGPRTCKIFTNLMRLIDLGSVDSNRLFRDRVFRPAVGWILVHPEEQYSV
jgi:hypothetical protein